MSAPAALDQAVRPGMSRGQVGDGRIALESQPAEQAAVAHARDLQARRLHRQLAHQEPVAAQPGQPRRGGGPRAQHSGQQALAGPPLTLGAQRQGALALARLELERAGQPRQVEPHQGALREVAGAGQGPPIGRTGQLAGDMARAQLGPRQDAVGVDDLEVHLDPVRPRHATSDVGLAVGAQLGVLGPRRQDEGEESVRGLRPGEVETHLRPQTLGVAGQQARGRQLNLPPRRAAGRRP